MSLARTIAERINPVLRTMGAQLVGNKQLEHFQRVRDKYLPELTESRHPPNLSNEARDYLRLDNPRLVELSSRISKTCLCCNATGDMDTISCIAHRPGSF